MSDLPYKIFHNAAADVDGFTFPQQTVDGDFRRIIAASILTAGKVFCEELFSNRAPPFVSASERLGITNDEYIVLTKGNGCFIPFLATLLAESANLFEATILHVLKNLAHYASRDGYLDMIRGMLKTIKIIYKNKSSF